MAFYNNIFEKYGLKTNDKKHRKNTRAIYSNRTKSRNSATKLRFKSLDDLASMRGSEKQISPRPIEREILRDESGMSLAYSTSALKNTVSLHMLTESGDEHESNVIVNQVLDKAPVEPGSADLERTDKDIAVQLDKLRSSFFRRTSSQETLIEWSSSEDEQINSSSKVYKIDLLSSSTPKAAKSSDSAEKRNRRKKSRFKPLDISFNKRSFENITNGLKEDHNTKPLKDYVNVNKSWNSSNFKDSVDAAENTLLLQGRITEKSINNSVTLSTNRSENFGTKKMCSQENLIEWSTSESEEINNNNTDLEKISQIIETPSSPETATPNYELDMLVDLIKRQEDNFHEKSTNLDKNQGKKRKCIKKLQKTSSYLEQFELCFKKAKSVGRFLEYDKKYGLKNGITMEILETECICGSSIAMVKCLDGSIDYSDNGNSNIFYVALPDEIINKITIGKSLLEVYFELDFKCAYDWKTCNGIKKIFIEPYNLLLV